MDHHFIADTQFGGHHLHFGAVGQPHPRGVLISLQQIRDRPPGPPQRQVLQVLTDVEQPQHRQSHDVFAEHQAGNGGGADQQIGAGRPATAQRPESAPKEGIAGEDGDAGGCQTTARPEQWRPSEHVAPDSEQRQREPADSHPEDIGVGYVGAARRPDGHQLSGQPGRSFDGGEQLTALAALR